MKKIIILLVLFMGAGIALPAQQFDNADFEQSANCDIDDCAIPDEMTCVDGWWQYIQIG